MINSALVGGQGRLLTRNRPARPFLFTSCACLNVGPLVCHDRICSVHRERRANFAEGDNTLGAGQHVFISPFWTGSSGGGGDAVLMM